MATAVSVTFKRAGKTYDFDTDGLEIAVGDLVVVKTTRGMETGQAVAVREAGPDERLKKIIRRGNDDDIASIEKNHAKERDARQVAQRLVSKMGLDMKVVDVEYVFDGSKILFYFTAEERVDFRDLVKELADELKGRIEMRQIGVRDEAKIIGGLGPCGQRLCCSVFAGDFEPVSIRMAKEQDLPLNPQKISGVCGRLMCCLKYEYEAYKDFKGRAPKKGSIIDTPAGSGKVWELQVPRETVVVKLEDGGGRVTVPLCDVGKRAECVSTAAGAEERRSETPERPQRPDRSGRRKDDRHKERNKTTQGPVQGSTTQGQPRPAAAQAEGEAKHRKRRRRRRPGSSDSSVESASGTEE